MLTCGAMTNGGTQRTTTSARGRPGATSHASIERAAFELFATDGFERTTMAAIARKVGVGQRTLFRYYPSKNDIPWGQFDRTLENFRTLLADQAADVPLHVGVQRAVVEFNRFPDDAQPSHLERMRLILTTPELQAHSAIRYTEWRHVIADHVASRLGLRPGDLLPQIAGHVSLGLALAAYEAWLLQPGAAITDLVDDTMASLRSYLSH